MKRFAPILAALALTGCASTAGKGPSPLFLALEDFLVSTSPNRTETTVIIGRERHTVTTSTTRDGRKATVRVD